MSNKAIATWILGYATVVFWIAESSNNGPYWAVRTAIAFACIAVGIAFVRLIQKKQ
ncbi:MAG: hypothetical protein SPK00_11215 [Corynebacterium glucuronolyticum]|nr:hypothetical protein [Corynebacterium glucuronolyticum]MDD7585544.1 hypothetical protein [Mycobacteriaceae bacterium]MDY5835292.1 hypothetical protein [Corynebacterium glucuronolyticum]